MAAIRLLAVEPDERYWRTFLLELKGDPRFGDAAWAPDVQQALQMLVSARPSIALVDLTVPDIHLMDLISKLVHFDPPAAIVGIADTIDDGRVSFAVGAGIAACLPKGAPARLIAGTLIEVAGGAAPIHREVAARPQILNRIIADFQRRVRGAPVQRAACPLTKRELGVLAMVADGHANKEIGSALEISERTVKNHMTNILNKLTARDRAHAVRIGMENAWIGNGAPGDADGRAHQPGPASTAAPHQRLAA